MDKSKIILAFILLLACSCTKEEDAFINKQSVIAEESNIPFGFSSSPPTTFSSRALDFDSVAFENFMQWTAYITTQAIMSDPSIRTEVFNLLDGRQAISYAELFDEQWSGNTLTFSTLFGNKFIDILRDLLEARSNPFGPGPNHASSTPPEPILACGCGSNETNTIYLFIEALLNAYCLELYMPEGFSPFTVPVGYTFTSTAHPLNNSGTNYGIIHYSQPVNDVYSDLVDVKSTSIDNNFDDIVMVVRPYRTQTSCPYEDYSDIDFTDFLN
ncbi:MAG: hypothetical protein AAFQ94_11530 [Bacteroidota bacterium]